MDMDFFETHPGGLDYSRTHLGSIGFKLVHEKMLLDLISNKELGIVAVLEVFTGPQCWINFQPDPNRPEDNYTLTPTSQQYDVLSVNKQL